MSSPPAFRRFPGLAPELRTAAWDLAIAAHVQDALQSLPYHLRPDPGGRRFWDNGGDHARLVDCFPILATCREARALAVGYFQRRGGPGRRFLYFPRRFWLLDARGEYPMPVRMSLGRAGDAGSSLEQQQQQPTTLYVSKGRFSCPEQLVDVAARYFGPAIERVVLEFDIDSDDNSAMSLGAYWPDPRCTAGRDVSLPFPSGMIGGYRRIRSPTIARHGPSGAAEVMSVSRRHREIRVSRATAWPPRCDTLALHLLMVTDLFAAAQETLPRLKRFAVHCARTEPPLDREVALAPPRDAEWTRLEGVVKGTGDDVGLFGWFAEYGGF
ncbi:hypothetical protein RB596_004005 [Gaeumannomyces avenae]